MKRLFTSSCILFLIIMSLNVQAQIEFTKHTIATISTPRDLYVFDLDGDGDKDIVTAGNGNGGEIRIYKNNGNKTFAGSAIATGIGDPRSVRAGDIDLDGDVDIIAAIYATDQVSWWENKGSQVYDRHDIDNDFDGAHTVELCDLDRDGDVDVLCCEFDVSAAMSDVAWWENDGEQNWTKHVVSSRFQQATFVFGADMDNDGDNDLVAAGEANGEVVWWKNDGNMNWTEIVIDGQFPKAHTIVPRDFDKDGDLDILAHACTSGLQAWYQNDGTGNFSKNEMENLAGAIWLDQGDFDNDGDYDMIATGMGENQLVCYENDGSQHLTKHLVNGALTSGFALNVADMDGDRDMDVIAIGSNSNTLAWWENITPPSVVFNEPRWIFRSDDTKQIFIANEMGSIGVVEQNGWTAVIRNGLPICTGIVKYGDDLWVNAGVELVCVNSSNGIKLDGVRVPSQFLCGLTSSEDGYLYATDPYSGTLIRIELSTGNCTIIKDDLSYPQAVRYDQYLGKLLVLDGEANARVVVIDPSDGAELNSIQTDIQAGGDIIGDGLGNYYLSSPLDGKIYVSTNDFSVDFTVYAESLLEPYGIAFIPEENKLVVMESGKPELTEILANATGIEYLSVEEFDLTIYPNPCTHRFTLANIESKYNGGVLSLFSLSGKLVNRWPINLASDAAELSIDLSASDHFIATGAYNLVLSKAHFIKAINVIIN